MNDPLADPLAELADVPAFARRVQRAIEAALDGVSAAGVDAPVAEHIAAAMMLAREDLEAVLRAKLAPAAAALAPFTDMSTDAALDWLVDQARSGLRLLSRTGAGRDAEPQPPQPRAADHGDATP